MSSSRGTDLPLHPVTGLGLDLCGLSKSYGQTPVLGDLDLSVREGELFTLLGPSGCGKTTTLRLIAGLERPDSGVISLGGRDISALDVTDRNVGLMFQRYALFQHMSVRANVAFGLKVRGVSVEERHRRVSEMLAIVGLTDLGERFPHQLSGGQMQRVALARTLVTRPHLLMLDEPFAALDAELRVRMRQFLKHLQRQLGLTTIVVTHDHAEALDMSDRVAIMQGGRLLQIGTPETLYACPADPEIAGMLGMANITTARWVQIDSQLMLEAGSLRMGATAGSIDSPGDSVTIMIRPESLRLGAPSGQARVVSVSFQGKAILYTVSDGAHEWRVERPASEPRLGPGQPVSLSVEPGAVWRFPSSRPRPTS